MGRSERKPNPKVKGYSWEILKEKSLDRFRACLTLKGSESFLLIAFEQAHFCIELILKACMEKTNLNYDDILRDKKGHNLKKLMGRLSENSTFFLYLQNDTKKLHLIQAMLSQEHREELHKETWWEPDLRYHRTLKSDAKQLSQLISKYEEAHEWIQKKSSEL